jgi:Undecaprenyl-phosphate galactose phosphotransferase WbaP
MLPLNLSSADATRDRPTWNVEVSHDPLRAVAELTTIAGPVRSRTKRMIDIVGALAMLFALMPVMLALALLVRADGGPVLFRQRRIGAGGKPFMCLKYRTMRTDAEAQLKALLARDPEARASWDSDFKLRVDPRITRFGGMLRQTSLDELPQLFNVLKGDMSLVGPRPIVAAEVPRYGGAIREYLNCRPGVTGLWQVSGRNDVDYPTRVKLDQTYVRNWSVFADIAILFRTVRVVLRGSGAY